MLSDHASARTAIAITENDNSVPSIQATAARTFVVFGGGGVWVSPTASVSTGVAVLT